MYINSDISRHACAHSCNVSAHACMHVCPDLCLSISLTLLTTLQMIFQLNKPATFKQKASTDTKPSHHVLPAKRPMSQPPFAKKRIITQLPIAMDTDPSAANPYKYVADTSQSEKNTNSSPNASSPPAVFDVNQLFRTSSNNSVSDSEYEIMCNIR